MFEVEGHVADVRLRLRARTIEDLFEDGVRGLFEVLGAKGEPGAAPVRRRITVDSVDRTALLVDLLSELLTRAHVANEAYYDLEFVSFTEREIVGDAIGIAPASFERDVKAVTYHEADIRFEDDFWETVLVLDI